MKGACIRILLYKVESSAASVNLKHQQIQARRAEFVVHLTLASVTLC